MLYDPRNRRIRKQVVQGGATDHRPIRSRALRAVRRPRDPPHLPRQRPRCQRNRPRRRSPGAPFIISVTGTAASSWPPTPRVRRSQSPALHTVRPAPSPPAPSTAILAAIRDAETGLIHLGARYYAPAIGRFVSPDWYILEDPRKPARIPQSFNVYSYAVNNPLVFRDPSGMWFFVALIVAFVVGFVVGTIYGLAKGQGWGSLLTGLETGLTTAIGFGLGAGAGFLLGLCPGSRRHRRSWSRWRPRRRRRSHGGPQRFAQRHARHLRLGAP